MQWDINRMMKLSGLDEDNHNGLLSEKKINPPTGYAIKTDADQHKDYSHVYENDDVTDDDEGTAPDEDTPAITESMIRKVVREEIRRYLASTSNSHVSTGQSHNTYNPFISSTSLSNPPQRSRPASLGRAFAGPGFM